MKVRITKTVTVQATDTGTVHYEAGWEGTAPSDHIERIVAAGCGERVDQATLSDRSKGKPGA